MDNPQIHIKELLKILEDILKLFISRNIIEKIFYYFICLPNFNIYHQLVLKFMESFIQKLLPDFIIEFFFQKFKIDEFLIKNLLFYGETFKAEITLANKYLFNQLSPAYLPYLVDIYKIIHFADNKIIQGFLKKSKLKA